jgi:leader peptidase (prepilin peptidase)/N-methyltransferase
VSVAAVDVVLGALLLATCAVAARVDVARRVIPNRLTGAAAIAAIAAGLAIDPGGEPARVAAAAGAGGLLLAAALAEPDGMGMGDVKLAGVMGLCLGPAVVVALAAAFAAGGLYGLAVLVAHGVHAARTATMPFAPCLALGSAAGVAVGLA